jgi:hypothetical protein
MLSLPLGPYGFGVDQVMLLPAILEIVSWLRRRVLTGWKAWAAAGSLLSLNLLIIFLLARYNAPNHDLFWPPLALLAIYTLARKARKR